jgi:O-antigen ligase
VSPRRAPLSRVLDLLIAGLGVTAIALTFTRSALLGVVAGMLALLLVARPKLVPLLPVAAVLFYLALPGGVRDRVRSTFDTSDETARDRVLIWKAGGRMIADHPLFGVGPGRVKELYLSYALPGAINKTPGHLHDNVIMTAAETGIPSALAYLWLVGAFGVGAFRLARSGGPAAPAARAALAAVVALFVAGFFEYNFGDVEILRATLVLMALPFGVREPNSRIPS